MTVAVLVVLVVALIFVAREQEVVNAHGQEGAGGHSPGKSGAAEHGRTPPTARSVHVVCDGIPGLGRDQVRILVGRL